MKTFLDYLNENHLEPGTKLKKGDEELEVVKPVGKDKYLVKEEEVDESTVVRTQNGRKMVSAEVAIRLAREIAARRKEGEKATTTDLKHATKALTREETEQIDELSSNTLRSYADKRMERVKTRYAELMAKQKAGVKVPNQEMGDYKKDLDNINKARDKAAYKRQGSRADRDGD